jgi:hypothetical protein
VARICGISSLVTRYRLDELGWYQFEALVQVLLKESLGIGVESWGGSHKDHGRDAFSRGPLRFPDNKIPAEGPFLFQAKFVESANAAGAKPAAPLLKAVRKEAVRITERMNDGNPMSPRWQRTRHYVLLTNTPLTPMLRNKVHEILSAVLTDCEIHCLGRTDLCICSISNLT